MNTLRSPFPILSLAFLALLLSGAVLMAGADSGHVKQLRTTGSCNNCDLRDAELPGLVAELADLRNADLRGAMMYKAILRDANFTGALLAFANLKGADLSNARGANLSDAITDEYTKCPGGSAGPCK